jgi:prevent-host-death family protein
LVVQVNMLDAKSQLSRLVKAALAGEEVIIASHGKAQVKLVPCASAAGLKRLGALAAVSAQAPGQQGRKIASMNACCLPPVVTGPAKTCRCIGSEQLHPESPVAPATVLHGLIEQGLDDLEDAVLGAAAL